MRSRRCRLKRGYQSNGGRDVRRLGNTGAQNRSNLGRQVRRSRQLGLENMYQYNNSGNVLGYMPPLIDEHTILRHLVCNANGIKPYPNDEGMISMSSNFKSNPGWIGNHCRNKCGMAEIWMEGKYIPNIKKNFWGRKNRI
jgi:hypothetical protein